MPSEAYRRWRTAARVELDEVRSAHAAIGGSGRGRRYATQQVNRAYAVLLAAQFQRFCRDLHDECVKHMVDTLVPSPAARVVFRAELIRGRLLDRGNAQPGSLGADFGRLGVKFWLTMLDGEPAVGGWKQALEELNLWRNAIAHYDFDPAPLGGTTVLRLVQVERWRVACGRLARRADAVLGQYLAGLTGAAPW